VQHRDTETNNEGIKWDFTKNNYKLVNDLLAKYPANYKQSAIIPLLDLAQQQNNGHLAVSCMNKVRSLWGPAPCWTLELQSHRWSATCSNPTLRTTDGPTCH
jgi:NADH dehydrogenase (ubiquinone) flavoprotein 2